MIIFQSRVHQYLWVDLEVHQADPWLVDIAMHLSRIALIVASGVASLSKPVFPFLFFFSCFFKVLPEAYGSSQARGLIGATASAYTTATTTAMPDSSRVCDVYHSSQQRRIPDPLSEARDWTRILVDTSWICFCCSRMGILESLNFLQYPRPPSPPHPPSDKALSFAWKSSGLQNLATFASTF